VPELVARDILRQIREGGLAPGSLLPPETQMLAQYNVGRASLREALRILEVSGLITLKSGPGGGPVVGEVSASDYGRMSTLFFQAGAVTYAELMDARLLLEPMLARLAAGVHVPAAAAELLEASRLTAGESGDELTYIRKSHDFHRLVCDMGGNRILSLLSQALDAVLRDRVVGGMLFPPEDRAAVGEVHASIAQAVADGEADRAEQLMRDHMQRYADYLRRRYPALIDEVVDWR
jgi:DNA-binding FadR family transcriptional regulator